MTRRALERLGWVETAGGDFRMAYTSNGVDCYAVLDPKPMGFWLEIYGQYGLIVSGEVDSFEDIDELSKYADEIIRKRGIA